MKNLVILARFFYFRTTITTHFTSYYQLGIKKNIFLFIFCSFGFLLRAQICNINAPDYVCLGDLASLSFSSSSTVTGQSWSFGDGNTSILVQPFHQYSTAGNYTISLTVQTNSGPCVTTKSIEVYPLPTASFTINNAALCLPRAELCFEDNSSASSSIRPLNKKIILWGDGAADSFSYPAGTKQCYTFLNAGTNLPFLLEVVDSKGCKNQDSIKINVYDGITSFDFHHDVTFGCDSNLLCFCNKSEFDTSLNMDFTWSFNGQEVKDNDTEYDPLNAVCKTKQCFTQKIAGNNVVKLIFSNKFGCKDTLTKNYYYNLFDFTTSLVKDADTLCKNGVVNFVASDDVNRQHNWRFEKVGASILQFSGNSFSPKVPSPGKWKLRYSALQNGCEKVLFDSIEVRGPSADISSKNAIQCNVNDTVYLADSTTTYLNGPLIRLWSFNDPNAPQCTTNTVLGKNIGLNCNFSQDSCAQHFYKDRQCYSAKLWVKDSLHGCEDSAFTTIYHNFLGPYNNEITLDRASNPVYCEYEEVVLNISSKECDWSPLAMFYDSANTTLKWERFKSRLLYLNALPVDDDGWVTLGIIRQFGAPGRFSGAKGQTYTADGTANCIDTVWLHKFFRIIPKPSVKPIIISKENCTPSKVVVKLEEKPDIDVYIYNIFWGDGNSTKDTLPNYILPDSFVHFYKDGINTNITFYVQSDSGCAGIGVANIDIGYNASFDFYKGKHDESLDPLKRTRLLCLGDTATFEDSVFYAGSFTSRWRETNVPEKLTWNFGDGSPQVNGAFPLHHVYNSSGTFKVLMIVEDSFNCVDTIIQEVLIPEVISGIAFPKTEINCGAIAQLFDSSVLKHHFAFDSIAKHNWTFGDNGAPSFLKNPFRNFSKPGSYKLTHIVENTYGCKDTSFSDLIVKGPNPYFEILSDTVACPNHLVLFDNMSDNASSYIWDFGKTSNNILSTSADTNVSYLYKLPGTFDIYLTAIDSVFDPFTGRYNYCSATFPDSNKLNQPLRRIRIIPQRKVDFLLPDTVCSNIEFLLEDKSDPIYSSFKWLIIDNGDSIKSNSKNTTYKFNTAGTYSLTYVPSYLPLLPQDPLCPDTIQKEITVMGFSAGFRYTFEQECGRYQFFDTSDNTVSSYKWTFGQPESGDKNEALGKNVKHTYGGDTGTFEVCLAVESRFGCKDTICKTVSNDFLTKLVLYNTFTPNGDGYNDNYDIDITNELDYQLSIYNRHGTLVYYGSTDGTLNDGENWNGKLRNVGSECTEGTYYYNFEYSLKCSDQKTKQKLNGVIMLMR